MTDNYMMGDVTNAATTRPALLSSVYCKRPTLHTHTCLRKGAEYTMYMISYYLCKILVWRMVLRRGAAS